MSVRFAELAMGIVTFALSVMVMLKSAELNIGWTPGRGPGAGAWPFWLGAGMALASIATIVRWFLRATPESRSREPYVDSDTVFLVIITALSVFALVLMMEFIGTYFAIMLFLLFYLRMIGRHRWYATMSFVLGAPLFIFCLFEWALQKDIPKGRLVPEELYFPLYDVIYSQNALTVGGIISAWIVASIVVGGLEERKTRSGLLAMLLVLAIGGLAFGAAAIGLIGQTVLLAGLVIAAAIGVAYHVYRQSLARRVAGSETI